MCFEAIYSNCLHFKICIYIQDVYKTGKTENTDKIRLYYANFHDLYCYDFGVQCLKIYRAPNAYKISMGFIGL